MNLVRTLPREAAPKPAMRRVGRLRRIALRVAVLGELFVALTRNGRLWLVPMLVIFLLAGIVLGAVQVVEYVAPFVYTMF